MSRQCDLSGRRPQVGHRISHSNIKSKRRFLPNLSWHTFHSETLGRAFRLRVSKQTLRSVDHRGGLDAYLMKAGDWDLSPEAFVIKMEVLKAKMAAEAAAAE